MKSTEAEKDIIEGVCRARVLNAMIAAFREVQLDWPKYPADLNPAANTGALCGVADLLVQLITGTADEPDHIAQAIAERIQAQVAARTSGGAA